MKRVAYSCMVVMLMLVGLLQAEPLTDVQGTYGSEAEPIQVTVSIPDGNQNHQGVVSVQSEWMGDMELQVHQDNATGDLIIDAMQRQMELAGRDVQLQGDADGLSCKELNEEEQKQLDVQLAMREYNQEWERMRRGRFQVDGSTLRYIAMSGEEAFTLQKAQHEE